MPTNPEGTTSHVRVPADELASDVRTAYLVRLDPADAQGSAVRYAFATSPTDGVALAALAPHPTTGRLAVWEPPPASGVRAPLRYGNRIIL